MSKRYKVELKQDLLGREYLEAREYTPVEEAVGKAAAVGIVATLIVGAMSMFSIISWERHAAKAREEQWYHAWKQGNLGIGQAVVRNAIQGSIRFTIATVIVLFVVSEAMSCGQSDTVAYGVNSQAVSSTPILQTMLIVALAVFLFLCPMFYFLLRWRLPRRYTKRAWLENSTP